MNTQLPISSNFNAQTLIHLQNNELFTTSLEVANAFNKFHKDVLKKIDSLECSEEFNRRNFSPVEYIDAKGEKRRAFNLTKNGFIWLVMGYNGKKAARIKEAYINAFDMMYEQLFRPSKPSAYHLLAFQPAKTRDYRTATDALRELIVQSRHNDEIYDRLVYAEETLVDLFTVIKESLPGILRSADLMKKRYFH